MSWQDKVKNSMVITTGDGTRYDFNLWIEASQEIDWNYTEFDYINIEGTKVDKRNVKGRKFPLKFFLQGDNHLEDTDAFRLSLNDKNPCILDHPYYGLLAVQILSLKINNTNLNISEFTGTAYETIIDTLPLANTNPVEQIQLKKIELDDQCLQELTSEPTITEINTVKQSNNQNYQAGIKIATLPQDSQNYFNAFNQASNAIDSILATPSLAIQAITQAITLPSKFSASVQAKITTLLNQMDYLRRTISGIINPSGKQLFEIQGLQIISSMCIAAASPLTGNYTNSTSVLGIINLIKAAHKQFIRDLDSLQTSNGGSPFSYIPGFQAVLLLNDLVFLTLSNLLTIALNGKKEITVILTEDSNLILLTYKYYGLDPDDNNIQTFINNNALNYRDTLIIKKGRSIVYYA